MTKKSKKSTKVALGGLAAALCLVTMFLTGIIPFSHYVCPAFAGLVLIAVAHENGFSTATLVYIAVSILSIFIVPIKESALLFMFFFGYYPVLQMKLIKIKPVIISYILRFIVFNIGIIAAYWVVINVLGITEIMDEFGSFGKYSAIILLVFGNVFFAVYDFMTLTLNEVYVLRFRPRFLKRLGG